MKELITKDRSFYNKLFRLALPIAGQNLIVFALNMLDTIMLGSLGENEIAAAGQANQPFFIFTLFLFGIASGSSVLISQYFGKKDKLSMERILAFALTLSAVISILFMIVVILIPEQVMRIYSKDDAVISLGIKYLRIVAPSYLMTAISTTYLSVIRAAEEVKIPLKVNFFALCLNGMLNYIFIFGKLGFPVMGIEGAALATLIARIVELVIVVFLILRRREKFALLPSHFLHWNRNLFHDFIKYAFPVILNETIWGLGVSMYSIIFGQMGTTVVAAYNVMQVVEKFAGIALMGLSNSAIIVLGQQLGTGRESKENALLYARTILVTISVIGVIVIGFLLIINPFIFHIYKISSEAHTNARQLLYVLTAAIPLKAINSAGIVGILRSGGDTRYALFLDGTGMWCVGLVCGFIAWKLGLPAWGVYIAFMLDEVYKMVLCLRRISSGKWIRNITREKLV